MPSIFKPGELILTATIEILPKFVPSMKNFFLLDYLIRFLVSR